jgi:uncharacterized protein (TIGR02118 family)
MIKVSVLYPNGANSNFDMNYYLTKHIPMVKQKLGSACKSVAVEEGIAGGAEGAPATYLAVAHLTFDSVDAFQRTTPTRNRPCRLAKSNCDAGPVRRAVGAIYMPALSVRGHPESSPGNRRLHECTEQVQNRAADPSAHRLQFPIRRACCTSVIVMFFAPKTIATRPENESSESM